MEIVLLVVAIVVAIVIMAVANSGAYGRNAEEMTPVGTRPVQPPGFDRNDNPN